MQTCGRPAESGGFLRTRKRAEKEQEATYRSPVLYARTHCSLVRIIPLILEKSSSVVLKAGEGNRARGTCRDIPQHPTSCLRTL